MKEIGIEEASSYIFTDPRRGVYERELLDFLRSDADACELYAPDTVIGYAVANSYRRIVKQHNLPVKVISRGNKVIAYKVKAYETLLDDVRSERYADRILKEVAEIEETAKISGEYEY